MNAVSGRELRNEHGDTSAFHAGYVSSCEITINAPASAVWPHVVDIGSWVYDFHFEHISGDRGDEGEVRYLWPVDAEGLRGIAQQERDVANAIVLKTLTITPHKLWYGINPPRLENGIRSTGVNLILLSERDRKTFVTAIRSKESLCPTEEIRRLTQANMVSYQPIAQLRWTEKYMPRLKELSERS